MATSGSTKPLLPFLPFTIPSAYFPLTGCIKFNAAKNEIENGIYAEPFCTLTFDGPLRWVAPRRLEFAFPTMKVKVGALPTLTLGIPGGHKTLTTGESPLAIKRWGPQPGPSAMQRGALALVCAEPLNH